MSGEWDRLNISTTDNFDFTGGTGGTGANMPSAGSGSQELRVVRPNIIGDIKGGNRNPTRARTVPGSIPPRWRARPARLRQRLPLLLPEPRHQRLEPRLLQELRSGRGAAGLQLRWEMFNVLNHTQYLTIDNTARFDVAGNQVNASFGEANAARNARLMQGSIRLSF